MSTHATIAILNKNGTVQSNYCHSDGYIYWNGEKLFLHYRDVSKVKELIKLGSIYTLYPELYPPTGVEHNFNKHHPNVSLFFDRDGDEKYLKDLHTENYNSLEDYLEKGYLENYAYIFDEKKKQWYMLNHETKKLEKLTSILLTNEDVEDFVKSMIKSERSAQKLEKELTKKQVITNNKRKI